jgi:hypothetical protein
MVFFCFVVFEHHENRRRLFYMQQELEINSKFAMNKAKDLYIKYYLNIKKIYGLSTLQTEILGLMDTWRTSIVTSPFGFSAENIALMLGYKSTRRRSISDAMNDMANAKKWEELGLPVLLYKITPRERSRSLYWEVNVDAIKEFDRATIEAQIVEYQEKEIERLKAEIERVNKVAQLELPNVRNGGVRMAIQSGYLQESEVEHLGDLENWNNFFIELQQGYGYSTIFIKQELNRVVKAIKKNKLHPRDKMSYFMKAIGQQEIRIKKGTEERYACAYCDEDE